MIDVKCNFSSKFEDTSCNYCMTNEDQTQEHLMRCTKILQQNPLIDNNEVMYSDIFGGVDKQSRSSTSE